MDEHCGWIEHCKANGAIKRRWATTNGGFLLLYKTAQTMGKGQSLDRKAACGGAMLPAAGSVALEPDGVTVKIFNKENNEAVMTLRCPTVPEAKTWLNMLETCQKRVMEMGEIEVEGNKENTSAQISGLVVMSANTSATATAAAAAVAAEEKARQAEAEKESMRVEIKKLRRKQQASEEIIKMQQQKMKITQSAAALALQPAPAVLAERMRLLSQEQGIALSPPTASAVALRAPPSSAPSSSSSSSSQDCARDICATAAGEDEAEAAISVPTVPPASASAASESANVPNAAVHQLRQEAEQAERELQKRRAFVEAEEAARVQRIHQLREEADRIQREEEAAAERARAEAELLRIKLEAEARAREEEARRKAEEEERARIRLALATKQAADRQYEALLRGKDDQPSLAATSTGGVRVAEGASREEGRSSWLWTPSGALSLPAVAVLMAAALMLGSRLPSFSNLQPSARAPAFTAPRAFGVSSTHFPASAASASTPAQSQAQAQAQAQAQGGGGLDLSSVAASLADEDVKVLMAADRIIAKAHAHAHAHSGGGSAGSMRTAPTTTLTASLEAREELLAVRAASSSSRTGNSALAFPTMLRALLTALTSPLVALQRVFSWFVGGGR